MAAQPEQRPASEPDASELGSIGPLSFERHRKPDGRQLIVYRFTEDESRVENMHGNVDE